MASGIPWRLLCLVLLAVLVVAGAPCPAQELLEGEFGNIDLGRPLIEPDRFPTIQQLRAAVQKPQIESVLMFKLYGDQDNHYLPVWSHDGERLAFQRSNLSQRSSKLLAYFALSDAQPTLLSQEPGAYDYMFRWGLNSDGSLVFARISSGSAGAQVYFSAGGREMVCKTEGAVEHALPDLYARTDGIWRLAYSRGGQLVHQAFDADGPVQEPLSLGRGTAPRWSRDGFRLLMARARGGEALSGYDMVLFNLQTEAETQLSGAGVVRSPQWSADESHAAFYVKEPGDNRPWRIQVCSTSAGGATRLLGEDVVVNNNFESQGPSWEPSGRRIWFFSHRHSRQAYYSVVAADIETGNELVIDYPQRCTVPGDLAVNPVTAVPELVFVAHDGLPQDLFVLFLNHY